MGLNFIIKKKNKKFSLDDLTGPINYYRNIVSEVLSPIRPESIRLRVPTMLIWGRNDTALKASMAPLSAK